MTIKEIEELAGMPRANIRYYEEEGLLAPVRAANGYRDYSEEDLSILKKIKLLRSLHMSMEEIKALHTGERELSVVLEQQIRKLATDREELDKAQSVCETMYKDGIKYESLDAEKYLKNLSEGTQYIIGKRYGETKESKEDMLPRVQAPWRRLFARMLDELVYGMLWSGFLFMFQISATNTGIVCTLVNTIAVLLITIVLEPLQLSLFGTTLGKWILGLRVLDYYDGKLSFSYAFDRTKEVLWYGRGFSIPVYNLLRMWLSYVDCKDGKELEWEYGSRIILKDEKKYRIAIYVAVYAILIGVNAYAEVSAILPVHRDEMTIAEFCENYRRLEKIYEVDSRYILENNGVWTQKEIGNNEIVVDLYGFGAPPDFLFELDDNGKIQKVSFIVEVNVPEDTPSEERRWVSNYRSQMNLAALAFIGIKDRPVDIINSHQYEGFEFSEESVTVRCDMQWQGYEPCGGTEVFAPYDEGECSFYMEFTMSKQ